MDLEKLEKLKSLKDQGILTEDEFQTQKTILLAEGTAKPLAPTNGGIKTAFTILAFIILTAGVVTYFWLTSANKNTASGQNIQVNQPAPITTGIVNTEKQKEESEKNDLQSAPDKYIKASKWEKYDKGIVNRYTKIISSNFTNESHFPVAEISGNIDVFSEDGSQLGSIPFSASGTLMPGETNRLDVTSGELSGNGGKAKFSINTIKIIGEYQKVIRKRKSHNSKSSEKAIDSTML